MQRQRSRGQRRDLHRPLLHIADMERNQRLKWARERRGFVSAAKAAEYLGIPYGTYSGHENGKRGIKDPELEMYARAYRVSLPWLAFGEGEPTYLPPSQSGRVPIVGRIGDDRSGLVKAALGLGEVTVPWSVETERWEAIAVEGNALDLVYRENSVLLYRPTHHDLSSLIDHECVIGLADGRQFVRLLAPDEETPGRWILESRSAAPIRGQDVKWASPIRLIQIWRTKPTGNLISSETG